MNHDRKAPTLSDIAKSAGVSLYTVSVVINGSRSNTRVSTATRARILNEAQRLHYYPNAMAQALVHGRMQSIGVIFGIGDTADYITNAYAAAVLSGILTASAAADCCVTLFPQPWLDAPRSAPHFRDGRTDGILIMAPRLDSDIISGLSALSMPLSLVACSGEEYGIPSVDVDDALGIRDVMDHLFSLGHRRIAHLAGSQNLASGPIRLAAFYNAMAAHGLCVPQEYVQSCSYDGDFAAMAAERLFALPEPPTAIVAGNDNIAIIAMNTARDRGIRIPEHLSITGFDDSPAAIVPTPALTTVRQPMQEIGEMATRLLLAQIEGETVSSVPVLIAPRLVVRGSTAPTRKG